MDVCWQGIDTGIRKLLQKPAFAPDHWSSEPVVQMNGVIIVDLLTEMFRARGPRFDFTFSGTEALEFMSKMADVPFRQSQAHTVILCADDPRGVPPEKAAEQKRRDRRHDILPYPDETGFCPAGIETVDGETLMDMRRVMVNRGLRRKLWEFAVAEWQRGVYRPPPHCTFVFDFCMDQCHVFENEHYGNTHLPHNQFGEADMKLAYWVNRYIGVPNEHIVVKSIDSDLMPILLHTIAMNHGRVKAKVTLRYWKDWWVDMVGLTDTVHDKLRLTAFQFVAQCILCGSDFVDKKRIFNQLGCEVLWNCFDLCKTYLDQLDEDIRNFIRIIRHVYGERWNLLERLPGRKTVLPKIRDLRRISDEKLASGKARQLQFPYQKDIEEVYEMVNFNLCYWLVDWNAYPQNPLPRTLCSTPYGKQGMVLDCTLSSSIERPPMHSDFKWDAALDEVMKQGLDEVEVWQPAQVVRSRKKKTKSVRSGKAKKVATAEKPPGRVKVRKEPGSSETTRGSTADAFYKLVRVKYTKDS